MKKLIFLFLGLTFISCGGGDDEDVTPVEVTPEPVTIEKFTLTVSATEGGSVDTTGGSFDAGTSVNLTATPQNGYVFSGWSGDSTADENTITITVNGNLTITANFNAITYQLTVNNSEGGTVDISGGEYSYQTSATIEATASDGYIFTGWSGSSTSTSNPLSLLMDSDKEISPIFTRTNEEYTFNLMSLSAPPFYGTIFITGEIITSLDPSLFDIIEYKGTGLREMYDRRNGGAWINNVSYLFDASFNDGLSTEIQINSEFTEDEATIEANKYAFLIGQLPKALRKDVETIWIHKGTEAYGGGNNNILIHTGMTESYENNSTGSIVEETLIHEAAHTSIDAYHYPQRLTNGEGWIEAVNKDTGCYISDYARDYPYREDIAELMPLYVAVKYFPERISNEIRDKTLSCSLNRILYFDSLNLDMSLYEN